MHVWCVIYIKVWVWVGILFVTLISKYAQSFRTIEVWIFDNFYIVRVEQFHKNDLLNRKARDLIWEFMSVQTSRPYDNAGMHLPTSNFFRRRPAYVVKYTVVCSVGLCTNPFIAQCRADQHKSMLQNVHCLKKVPTFELSVTLSSLNRFSTILHCCKAYKIATKCTR